MLVAASLAVASILAACSGGGADTVGPPAVGSVTVSPSTVSLQGVGATASVSAAIAPAGASGTITWRSDGPTIATVAGSGSSATITAVAAGTTTIVGSVGGVSGSTTVTVVPIVRGILPSRTTAGVLVGGTTSLTAALNADAGASSALSWSSSALTIATVDASGVVSGVAPGSSTITVASTAFPTISATIAVTVAYPLVRTVTVAPSNPSVVIGSTRQMTATVDTDAGTPTLVVWSSSSLGVATVSSSGLVTAVASGTTTIRATSSANPTVSGITTLTVTAPTVRSITMTPAAAAVTAGDVQQFALTVDADAGASTAVTWTSSNAEVATVSASGLVSTLSTGTTTITATSVLVPAIRGQATLTVLTPPIVNAWQQRTLTPLTTDLVFDVDQAWSVNSGLAFAISTDVETERRVLTWDGVVWNFQRLSPFDNVSALGGAGGEVFIGSTTGRMARYLAFAMAAAGFVEMSIPAVGCIRTISSAGVSASIALASATSNCFNSRAILLYQGSSWTRLPDPPALTTVIDVTAASPTNIVAVGLGGTGVQRWDGASWSSVTAPPTASGNPQSVALLGADLVVVTGAAASARLTGATWTSIAPPTPRPNADGLFLSKLRVCNGQLYTGTTMDGRVFRLDGTAWSEIASYGVAVVGSYTTQVTCGADNVLRAVGANAAIGRYTGSAWVWETASPWLFKSAIVRSDLAYAVGGNGVVQRWNGVRWQVDLSISSGTAFFDQLSASDDGLVLASGSSLPTGVWRKSGASWAFDALSYVPKVIWAASSSFALSVGATTASQFNGTSWQTIAPPPSFNPIAIDGTTASFAIAVGGASGANSARAFRWTGSAWEAMTLPAGQSNLIAVEVVSPTLAYAVSSTNAVLRYNGTQWTVVTGPTASAAELPLRAVAATGASDVYLLSSTGALFHYDGTGWIRLARFASEADVFPFYTSLSIAKGVGLITGAGGRIFHGANGATIRTVPLRRR